MTIYAELLAKLMSKDGVEVKILSSRVKGKKKEEKEGKIKITRSWVMLRLGKGLLMPFYIWDSFWEVKKADVVNCHLPQLESAIVALWALLLGKKLVITHHCEFGFDGTLSNRIIAGLSFPFHLFSYLTANKIVSYTEDYANKSIFLRMFRKKVVFVLPPILIGKKREVEIEKIRRELKVGKAEKVVGYVGRIAWEKGLNFLIEAGEIIAKKRKLRIVLIGPYKDILGDKSVDKLRELIKKSKVRVDFLGAIEHDNLVSYYQNLDCLVLPSTNNLETFGIVQAEAMLCGCPVVASDLPGVRMPVKLTGLGKISKIGSSRDLAKKIEMVLNKRYGEEQYRKAKELFDLKVFEENYKEVLGI